MNLLIVDDEHHIVNYLAMLVEDNIHEDLEVYRAYSGSQALAVLSETMIDLIFLDIQMPGMSGLELASKITVTWPHCRLIFLTAYDTFDYIYQTRNFPSSQYLLKTESDQTILATLTGAMDSILEERNRQTTLDTVNRKNRYLSHLLSQRLLRMLLADTSPEILQAEYEFVHADFPFRPDAPFFLMYMNIRHRNLAESRSPSPDRVLEYLQMMDYQLAGRFVFSALHLDNGDFLWFFQTLPDADFGLSRPETYLKNIMSDFAAEFSRVFHRETFFFCILRNQIYHRFHTFCCTSSPSLIWRFFP